MTIHPQNVRVKVILRTGSSKHEVRSPDPIPRDEAEKMIGAIRKTREEETELEIPWLAARGADVAAAYIEVDPDDDQRTIEEMIADLEPFGVIKRADE